MNEVKESSEWEDQVKDGLGEDAQHMDIEDIAVVLSVPDDISLPRAL